MPFFGSGSASDGGAVGNLGSFNPDPVVASDAPYPAPFVPVDAAASARRGKALRAGLPRRSVATARAAWPSASAAGGGVGLPGAAAVGGAADLLSASSGLLPASSSLPSARDFTKGEWKKIKHGPPICLEELQAMFDITSVDGSTSCVPGQLHEEGIGERDEDEGDANDDNRTCSPNPLKRASGSTATSPKKTLKSPMVKIMKGMWDTMQNTQATAQKVHHNEIMKAEMKEVLDLTIECGANEGSAEHFMAMMLFAKAENRAVFQNFRTNEARLGWLKMWCTKEGY